VGVLFVWLVVGLLGPWLALGERVWELRGDRLIRSEGFFTRRQDYLDVHRIQDAWVSWTLRPWVWDCGYVTVISTDKTDPVMVIGPVHHPDQLAEQLQKSADQLRKEQKITPQFS
jgi:hypothetical protein